MQYHTLLFCLLSIGYTTVPSPDTVSALTDINQAIAASRHLAIELKAFASTEEARLTKLRQLIQRLNSASEVYSTSEGGQATNFGVEEEAAANPVSAFLIILRLASNWSSELSMILEVPNVQIGDADALVTALMEFDSRRKLFLKLKRYADMLPDDNDVQGALDAVVRLQQTYNISSMDIAEGRILPFSSSPSLTGKCFLCHSAVSFW